MLKHNFVSAKANTPDPDDIDAGKWNEDHVIDADGATMATRADAPAAPAAGKLVMFGKLIGGGALPAFVGPSGFSSALQPFLGRNKVMLYAPQGNSTSVTQLGAGFSSTGTGASRNVTTTNFFASIRRIGFTTATTANSRAMINGPAQFFLGSTPGMGGFRYVARFGTSDAAIVAGANMFCGLSGSSGVGNGASVASALNILGLGADAGDTNMQIFCNDATGTATKVDLGANFPANTTNVDMYELAMFAPSGSAGNVYWQVIRLNTGDTASGTISTDMPAVNQLLLPIIQRSNLSTGLSVGLDVAGVYIESDN